MAPPENELDEYFVPLLLPSDYGSDNKSDDKDEDTDTYTQQRQKFNPPEATPPMVSNVYNLRPRKKNDYTKEKIDQLMLFTQVGNDLKEDALSLLQH